jgi:hypothetical protein
MNGQARKDVVGRSSSQISGAIPGYALDEARRKKRKLSVSIVAVPSPFEPGTPEYTSCYPLLFVSGFYRQMAQEIRLQAAL